MKDLTSSRKTSILSRLIIVLTMSNGQLLGKQNEFVRRQGRRRGSLCGGDSDVSVRGLPFGNVSVTTSTHVALKIWKKSVGIAWGKLSIMLNTIHLDKNFPVSLRASTSGTEKHFQPHVRYPLPLACRHWRKFGEWVGPGRAGRMIIRN